MPGSSRRSITDAWDVDQSQQGLLVNFKYHGVMQKAIVSASKDGLWYVLNRATGKPIIPVTETPVPQSAVAHTWPTQPDSGNDAAYPDQRA